MFNSLVIRLKPHFLLHFWSFGETDPEMQVIKTLNWIKGGLKQKHGIVKTIKLHWSSRDLLIDRLKPYDRDNECMASSML